MIQSLIRKIYDMGSCHENSTLKSGEVQDEVSPPQKKFVAPGKYKNRSPERQFEAGKPELSKLIGINNLKGLAILESHPSRSVRAAIVRSWCSRRAAMTANDECGFVGCGNGNGHRKRVATSVTARLGPPELKAPPFTAPCLCRESRLLSNVYENRMFRHVLSPVKHACTLKTHHSSYATLPQQLPTPTPIDGPRHSLRDDLPSVEKKSRKRKDGEDFSRSFFLRRTMARNDHLLLPVRKSKTQPSRRATPVASFTPPDIQKFFF